MKKLPGKGPAAFAATAGPVREKSRRTRKGSIAIILNDENHILLRSTSET